MTKNPRGSRMPPLALPICLLGANVDGNPNYCTIAWFTMIDDEPPTIGLVTGKDRKTKDGIVENRTFSVSVPSADMAVPVDYVGITSGRKEDKSTVFRSFYGKLKTAPMVEECPVTMECELRRIVELEGTDLIIGEIVEVYVEESVYHGDEPDPLVLDPLMYLSSGAAYHRLGERVDDAFKAGKKYRRGT